MFESTSLGPEILANPGQVQLMTLTELENRLNGTIEIADPNNGVAFMWEFGSSVTSQFVKMIAKKYQALYRKRAVTAEELYAFMSDYDYVNIMANPAMMQFRLVLDANWIVNNAVYYDENYNKIVIPDTTVITVGDTYFGLYYPIEFLVNRTTGAITTLYDLSTPNPLLTMSTNIPDNVNLYSTSGLTLLSFTFPAYQFQRTEYNETLNAKTGFIKTYSYTNKFYAARVYTTVNGVETELAYTLSRMQYDTNTPTLLMTILEDTGKIKMEIPQIYFTNGLIGTKLRIELFTTEGAVNKTFTEDDIDNNILVNFDTGSSTFAAPMAQPSTMILLPYDTYTLDGGSDPMDFATFRNEVVNDTLNGGEPIRNMEVTAAGAKLGFNITKILDNITDRVYSATAPLKSTSGYNVPTVVGGILLTDTYLKGDPSTILPFDDGSFTILPTTVFKYNTTTDISVPLLNSDRTMLGNLSSLDLAAELNNNVYTRQPFHIVVNTETTPSAKSYNLMNPACTSLLFVRENVSSAAQMSIASASGAVNITHAAEGAGGFTLRLGVKKSSAMANVDMSNCTIILMTQTKSSNTVVIQANYVETLNGFDVFQTTIPTNYHISSDDYFQAMLTTSGGLTVASDIPLEATFDVRLCVAKSDFPTLSEDTILQTGLSNDFSQYLVVSQQAMTIKFGEDLSPIIANNVTTTWGNQVLATYAETQYKTYPTDVYQRDASGVLTFSYGTAADGTTTFDPVLLHAAGDVCLDTINLPLVAKETSVVGSVLPVYDTTGVLIGMPISGVGILKGSTITAFDPTASTITLSQPTTQPMTDGTQLVAGATITEVTTPSAQTEAGVTLPVSSIDGIYEGMTVYCVLVPAGTTVASVGTDSVTLSAASTGIVPAGAVVTFMNLNGPKQVQFKAGDIRTDANGNQIVVQGRSNQYLINAMQFDGRLYASTAAADVAYVAGLPALLTSTGHILDTLRSYLWERTYIYYSPTQTIGRSEFSAGNNKILYQDLGLSFSVTLYVSEATMSNTALCTLMENTVISTLNNEVNNSIISMTNAANTLKTIFGDSVESIDVEGIDGDPTLQTLIPEGGTVNPSVAWILDVNDDGSLSMVQDITVTFKLAE